MKKNKKKRIPVNECKEANFTLLNTYFPLFMYFFLALPILYIYIEAIYNNGDPPLILFFSTVIYISIILILYFCVIKRIIMYYKVKRYGQIINAKVLGYINDDYSVGDKYGQKAKLLITKENDKEEIILYQTGSTKQKYAKDEIIELLLYKDYYLIKDLDNYKKYRIPIIMNILLSLITILLFTKSIINCYTYNIFGFSFNHKVDMFITEILNNKIRYNNNELEYEMPNDFYLDKYIDKKNYEFANENGKHSCYINIFLTDYNSKMNCNDKININNTEWCYYEYINGSSPNNKKYSVKKYQYIYNIVLSSKKDTDEYCYKKFDEFLKTIKLK